MTQYYLIYLYSFTVHSKNINYKAILNDLNLHDAKKAGTILDGCKVNYYFNMKLLKLLVETLNIFLFFLCVLDLF